MSNEPPTLQHLLQTQQCVAGVETSEACDTVTGHRELSIFEQHDMWSCEQTLN